MKILLLLCCLSFAGIADAQYLPNPDFEFWTESEQDTLPKDWANSYFGVGRSDVGAHGEYAVTIWNWYSYSKGRIALGEKDILENDLIRSGIPFPLEGRGTFILTGQYKYILGGNGGQGTTDDSAVVFVLLKKYNYQTQQSDTAAFAVKKLGPSTGYSLFSVPIYVNRDSVDSLALLFYSSERGFCNSQSDGNCLYFTLDNLHHSYIAGLRVDANRSADHAMPYPNPFVHTASFGIASYDTRLTISNTAGIEVLNNLYTPREEIHFDGGSFPAGMYFYRIQSADGYKSGCLIKQ